MNPKRTRRQVAPVVHCGYVVSGPHGVLQVGHYADTPSAGVLVAGDYGTVFNSRRAALAAIKRSEDYCVKEELDWAVWKWKIYQLKAQ